ncbi:MAG: hypothetical protein ACI4TJ_04870, partial [Candidatus Cryptobacteroides sp.]
RDEGIDEDRGPKRFSLMYICGDGAATYAALYSEKKIAPTVLAIIHPGTGWGGNYTDFFNPEKILRKIIDSGKKRPLLFYGGGYTIEYDALP